MEKLNTVYCKDWTKNELPDKSVQLIIADPPYFEVKGEFDFIWASFDDYLKDVEKWAIECKRLLADNGTLFWWGHAKKIAYTQIILDKYFNLENSLVWEKIDCQNRRQDFEIARTFAPVTERLLMYSNESNGMNTAELNYSFQIGKKHTEIMEPIIGYLISEMERAGLNCAEINKRTNTQMASHWFARTSQWMLPTKQWYEKLRIVFNGDYLRKEYDYLRKEYDYLRKEYDYLRKEYDYLRKEYDYLRKEYDCLRKEYEELRRPFNNINKLTDVLRFYQEAQKAKKCNHPTKKPETLTRVLISTCSRKNDIVFVPFAGSGTECAMAVKEGRRFIGFDIEKKYADMANKRCQNELLQFQLF